jgi:hypothetical protein
MKTYGYILNHKNQHSLHEKILPDFVCLVPSANNQSLWSALPE